ncbi:branched-chain amino acid ABC transporter permease [Bradyrhizobium sediminis]|uniref:Branched-chain amino acid ABC transporter permease n=1 Tax=Bradyrhizobium sediminis TaxID=2840469 RepID=A0A975NZ83_9BRAD|nr:branched-chain amino acid ABC transporter permease [Bradyrhizobium sediminis]QWG24128.1 branched-chain amino acid ABC transporter permease [Bradyrhizobium sediminis]
MLAYWLFFMSGLAVGALYALGGVGLVILNRATGVLNFAYGAIGALGAMVAWQLLDWGYPEPIAWLASIGLGSVLSSGFGRFVAPGLAHREPVVKAVATLGLAIALLGLMNLLWVTTPRKLTLSTDALSVSLFGMRITGTRLLALGTGIVMTFAMGLFLTGTRLGLMMRALADNRRVASLLGVPIMKVETIAWSVSGALAGFTGLLFGDLVRLDPTVLTFIVIPVIATTVIGRMKSIPVTFGGGLFIGVFESMLALYPPVGQFRVAAPFVVAIAMLMWLQRGRYLTFAGED